MKSQQETNSAVPADTDRSEVPAWCTGGFKGQLAREPQSHIATVMCNKYSWALPSGACSLVAPVPPVCTGVTGVGFRSKILPSDIQENYLSPNVTAPQWRLSDLSPIKIPWGFRELITCTKTLCNPTCTTLTRHVPVLGEDWLPQPPFPGSPNVWKARRPSDIIRMHKLYN